MIRIMLIWLALLPLCVAAQMYKWVDEKGVTHYSETPPLDGKGTKIDIKPSSGPGKDVPATDWKQKELDARQNRIQQEQKEHEQEAQQQNQASARKMNCLESQRQLSIAQAPRPLFQVNEKGEKIYLDEKARDHEIAGWQANAKKYCE